MLLKGKFECGFNFIPVNLKVLIHHFPLLRKLSHNFLYSHFIVSNDLSISIIVLFMAAGNFHLKFFDLLSWSLQIKLILDISFLLFYQLLFQFFIPGVTLVGLVIKNLIFILHDPILLFLSLFFLFQKFKVISQISQLLICTIKLFRFSF